jgi:hypothetical protein
MPPPVNVASMPKAALEAAPPTPTGCAWAGADDPTNGAAHTAPAMIAERTMDMQILPLFLG